MEDRLAKFSDGGFAFIKIGDDFEGYFETLRKLGGDPKEGVQGHVLPKFDTEWVTTFGATLQNKIGHWKKVRDIAERHVKAKKDGQVYDALEVPVWVDTQETPLQLQSKL